MAKQMMLDDELYLRLLLYGEPGSGKTRTCATAALDLRSGPVLWLNSHGNPISARDMLKPGENCVIIDIAEVKDINDPFNWLAGGQKSEAKFAKDFGLKPGFKTFVFDGITDFQRLSFKELLTTGNVNPADFFRKREWEQYDKVLRQSQNLASMFYSLKMHVIITALEKNKEDRVYGTQRFQPLLDGQADQEVPGMAWMVGRMVHVSRLLAQQKQEIKKADAASLAEDSVTAMFVKPTNRYQAKDQYGMGPDFLIDPTITQVLDLIHGEEPVSEN